MVMMVIEDGDGDSDGGGEEKEREGEQKEPAFWLIKPSANLVRVSSQSQLRLILILTRTVLLVPSSGLMEDVSLSLVSLSWCLNRTVLVYSSFASPCLSFHIKSCPFLSSAQACPIPQLFTPSQIYWELFLPL